MIAAVIRSNDAGRPAIQRFQPDLCPVPLFRQVALKPSNHSCNSVVRDVPVTGCAGAGCGNDGDPLQIYRRFYRGTWDRSCCSITPSGRSARAPAVQQPMQTGVENISAGNIFTVQNPISVAGNSMTRAWSLDDQIVATSQIAATFPVPAVTQATAFGARL